MGDSDNPVGETLAATEMEKKGGIEMYRAVFARLGDEAHVTRERSRRIQDAFQSWETVCHLSKWEGPVWGGDRNGKFCFTYVDFEMPGRCPNGDDN